VVNDVEGVVVEGEFRVENEFSVGAKGFRMALFGRAVRFVRGPQRQREEE
jgi:hypothetical protein